MVVINAQRQSPKSGDPKPTIGFGRGVGYSLKEGENYSYAWPGFAVISFGIAVVALVVAVITR